MNYDTKLRVQAILNRVFDNVNKELSIKGSNDSSAFTPDYDTFLKEQVIFNRIFDESDKSLKVVFINF